MKSRILDPKFKYVPAAATDIQATWRKFGWRPTNELPYVRVQDNSFRNQDRNVGASDATAQGVRSMRE
jgi:hypothetical protein